MRRRLGPAALAIAGALALAGCGGSDSGASGGDSGKAKLSAGSAYMPQPVSGDMAAGFLTVTNKGDAADELTSVTSDIAGQVTVHETVDGAMQEVKSLKIPAGGRLELKSGGDHLMFEQLKSKPKEGQTVSVELHFAHSGPMKVEMPVKPATYTPKTGH
ncbi:copper chaperone PCu(A)C [Streptomyces sp. NEAU-H22]|uniref:copper chaperone PCu(A)C n=1 Tax=unclassified Streptomyces TaxID=2593676 RepID=UPI00224FBCAD|nr:MULTISPECIES: copper chaperone PCu(A)C [unclassified Streptomyces]MCX3287431.1 copper chaperone PCu(A)C [Streptomyces sp. NEAU-H22]WMD09845.1 copper chaperone PCu(A)C [Streptomyces sp. FXY-T5]